MASSKKPRKKYRPKGVTLDPIGYVVEGNKKLTSHNSYVLDLKIKNSLAMGALLRGEANKADMDTLVAMSNITEMLQEMGFGVDYENVCVDGRAALISVAVRAVKLLRFTPTGEEIKSLNKLMELHDAQMDVITVRDLEKAINTATKRLRSNDRIIKLPKLGEVK
jgi:hypothetical protein